MVLIEEIEDEPEVAEIIEKPKEEKESDEPYYPEIEHDGHYKVKYLEINFINENSN